MPAFSIDTTVRSTVYAPTLGDALAEAHAKASEIGTILLVEPAPYARPFIETQADALALDNFLASVIVTAVEGGLNYWAEVLDYAWHYPDLSGGKAAPTERGGANAYATLRDREADDEDPTAPLSEGLLVTPEGIAKAFEMLRGPVAYLTTQTRYRLLGALDDREGGDVDSSDADNLVQLAVFGEIVYG